ncbi:PTS sugar transporter subunit IIC [Amedibacterium intestinale]|uniref:PTS sorbose transporter subunit IIC n=1 Tax=Amedibacterium intestinale TaxID=2583452 RepID=A0A6N4TGZ6_9FIRM|nr:PTS sugar transporter subunit IIC [Amedibacterium intestinale]RHO20058.1 PTS sugar transporter subunit IIC [Eubacterium sp. AM18-26]RHO23714.1 PTS sugar transporter subunit IIC [Eubacterium sp. AM18-10LB-B]BBK22270.1 PTS sorbose transporter subunit IIC [Amedibacterium intestinale]
MSWLQAILIGIMSCTAASTIACLGTSVGNYTLNRPLVASMIVGLILNDVSGCIQIGIPMQLIYIALVTPGGTVAADLRAVSYIGIPLAYVAAREAGWDFGGEEAKGIASALATATGTIGISQFYGTAMMNLIWQHIGWAKLDKGDLHVVGKVDALYPLISHFLISFIPVTLLNYYGSTVVSEMATKLSQDSIFVQCMIQVGNLLPCVGIAILLKSVVTKATDLIMFLLGFVLAGSMGLTLIAAALVGVAFGFINYQITMLRNSRVAVSAMDDDEEDI